MTKEDWPHVPDVRVQVSGEMLKSKTDVEERLGLCLDAMDNSFSINTAHGDIHVGSETARQVRNRISDLLVRGADQSVGSGVKRCETNKSEQAASLAIQAHKAALGIEGDDSVQMWHLLASLLEWCRATGVDLDAELSDVRQSLHGVKPRATRSAEGHLSNAMGPVEESAVPCVSHLALEPVGDSVGCAPQSVLHGQMTLLRTPCHVTAIQVEPTEAGGLAAVSSDYADELEMLYGLCGASPSTTTIGDLPYVVFVMPHAT